MMMDDSGGPGHSMDNTATSCTVKDKFPSRTSFDIIYDSYIYIKLWRKKQVEVEERPSNWWRLFLPYLAELVSK